MRLGDLTETIMDKVQDPSIDAKRIRRMINQACDESASVLTDPLPDCETQADVSTVLGRAFASLPNDFHRDLEHCFSVSRNDRVRIYPSLQYLRAVEDWHNLTRVGQVYGVARRGDRLYYQGIPETSDTLTIHYTRKPLQLAKDNDEPVDFPSFSHEPLIVNYVLKELFSEIEDGIEGPKTNTEYHDTKWVEAIEKVELFYGPKATEPPQIHDMTSEMLR